MAEELIASDWAKIWCNLLGLVATNCPRENLWEYRTGWKVPRQDKCKVTHSSSKKEIGQESRADCFYPVVLKPVPMTQSDWFPGDYNMTTWRLNCLCRTGL